MLFRTPKLLPLLYPRLIWHLPTAQKIIYLTFDDGPTPGPTHFVLASLKHHQARATFFCLGKQAADHPTLLQQIIKTGHRIGNHTYNHMEGWHCTTEEYLRDVQKCQDLLRKTNLFRPPYGKLKKAQIKKLNAYNIIMWDVLTFDFLTLMSPEKCLRGTIRATRPGSIVVFHDSHKAEKYVRFILPRYLEHFRSQGYDFHTIPQYLPAKESAKVNS